VSLDTVVRRAGAVMVERDGGSVAAHYGSAAGELAVCMRAVGIADRSDLGKLIVSGEPEPLAELLLQVAGVSLAAPGAVAERGGAWWCAAGGGRALVLCDPARRAHLLDLLRAAARRRPSLRLDDVTAQMSAIAVVGRSTRRVLAELGALGPAGDPRRVPPFGSVRIAGAGVSVLLQSDESVLLLVPAPDADRVWHAVERAGRPFVMGCVGLEALERFTLVALSSRRCAPPART
jgi:glycine cleavage system aminomethyltransferase T